MKNWGMYKWLIVVLILASCKPKIKKVREYLIEGQKISDSNIIFLDTAKGEYHFVYIEHNRRDPFRLGATDFNPDSNEKSEYKANYLQAKGHYPHRFKSFDLHSLSRQWVPLYLYKGRYYLYVPSEWGLLDRRTITDSAIVYWPVDGPTPFPIVDAKKTDATTYEFKMHSTYDNKFDDVKIHIVDPSSQMAVWESPRDTSAYRYQLFVPLAHAGNFDIIINYCRGHKTGEFNFDKIDYEALLKIK